MFAHFNLKESKTDSIALPTSVSENSASAGLYLFSFGLTSVIPMIFGLLSQL